MHRTIRAVRGTARLVMPMFLCAMDGRLKTKLWSRRTGIALMLCVTAATLLLLFQSTRAGGLLRLVLQYSSPPKMSPIVDPFLIDVEERTFRFFWDTANPKNGLIPDRFPTPSDTPGTSLVACACPRCGG